MIHNRTVFEKIKAYRLIFAFIAMLFFLFYSQKIDAFAASGTYNDCTWDYTGTTLTVRGGTITGQSSASAFPWYTYEATATTINIDVSYIGDNAFYNCKKASSITIGSNVWYVGYRAFYYVTYNSGCHIYNNYPYNQTVGTQAFYYLGKSSSYYGYLHSSPANQNFLINTNYYQGDAYKIWYVDRYLDWWFGWDGIKWNYNGSALTVQSNGDGTIDAASTGDHNSNNQGGYPWYGILYRDKVNSIYVTAANIGYHAFYSCDAVSTIYVNVTGNVMDDAFYNCSAATSIRVRAASIWQYAFYNCKKASDIRIAYCVSSIGYRAFYYASHNTTANVYNYYNGNQSVGTQAFYYLGKSSSYYGHNYLWSANSNYKNQSFYQGTAYKTWTYFGDKKCGHESFFQSGWAYIGNNVFRCCYLCGDWINYEAATITGWNIPDKMGVGQSITATVTVRNDGWSTWPANSEWRLGGVDGTNTGSFAATRQYLSTNVAPGASYTFSFAFTAPSTYGIYSVHYRMVRDGYWWFGNTYGKNVTVCNYIDLNGLLDGANSGAITNFGTADVYINGTLVANDVSDYCTYWPSGTKWQVTDIKAKSGKTYIGCSTNNLTGTIGTARIDVRLQFGTNCTVTLNQQNGSGGTTSVTAVNGKSMPAITTPTRTGFTFLGYYTSANASGTQYYNASGVSAKNWDKTVATTLYAGWKDTAPPVIARATYVVDGNGYTVYAYATDSSSGMSRLCFPTWTELNGKDDIQPNWSSASSTAVGTAGSFTIDSQTYNYKYYVNKTAHNNESGPYTTHIYAYDNNGNYSTYGLSGIYLSSSHTFYAGYGTFPNDTVVNANTFTEKLIIGTSYTPPTPVRLGYTFVGYTNWTGNVPVNDGTHTAQWTPNEYVLTLNDNLSTQILNTYNRKIKSGYMPHLYNYN